MSTYINYPLVKRITIKETGKLGHAFKRGRNLISVFLDEHNNECVVYNLEDIEFITKNYGTRSR